MGQAAQRRLHCHRHSRPLSPSRPNHSNDRSQLSFKRWRNAKERKQKVIAPLGSTIEFFASAVVANSSKNEKSRSGKSGPGADALRNPRTPGRSSCAPAELYPPTRTETVTKESRNENLKTNT